MALDFEKLHSVFFGNCNHGMYTWLAESLGVSTDSLKALQIGWVPAVKFKSDKYGYGFFSIPERDATGKVVGISLRSREGTKIKYPGSGAGCTYVVNPNHRKGDRGYSSGEHNWRRTADATVLCPVCGKPDGCLVSAENAADPKAAVCIRTESKKRLRFGFLHILKPEGNLADASLLDGTGTVIVVEGMSDVAAAMDLGYTAIGRPNNITGQDIVAELVRGRPVIVMGENDKKADGKWPGRDGMYTTYATVRKHTHSCKMVMPPEAIKDLRYWKVVNGLTREDLEVYFEKAATETVDDLVLKNNDPLTVADRFLIDTHSINKRKTSFLLRRWEDNWYIYAPEEGRYKISKDAEIQGDLYQWSKGRQYEVESAKGVTLERLVVGPTTWAGFIQAASSIVLLRGVDKLPAWINGAEGPDTKDLIVFSNGVLNIPEYLNGGDALSETTPDLFNTTSLPVPFSPVAGCPTWLSFLESSLGDDCTKIDLLQEWVGYCLTPDTTRHKLMYFRGESGGGKGTVLRVMQSLVGSSQYASSSLSQLAESFGLQPLIGKLICTIGDARLSRNADAMRGLEVLLGLTGGDAQQINRKFKDQLEGSYLTARITIASNDFLDVPDHSGAMLRRLNVIQFSRSFKGKEDITLGDKLEQELEGIAIWALQGLKRLRENGAFTEPESSRAALLEWERDTNPLAAWLQDCTVKMEHSIAGKDELYDCWSAWAKDTHRGTWTRSVFLRRLQSLAGYISDVGSGLKGLSITPGASRRWLGRP